MTGAEEEAPAGAGPGSVRGGRLTTSGVEEDDFCTVIVGTGAEVAVGAAVVPVTAPGGAAALFFFPAVSCAVEVDATAVFR